MSKNSTIAIVAVLVLVGLFVFMSQKKEPTPVSNVYVTPTKATTPTPTVTTTPNVTTSPTVTPTPVTSKKVTVTLNPDKTNVTVAQSGTMTLEETDKGLSVTLKMTGFQSTVAQPAHIHSGTCPTVGKVVYPLTNVVGGNSTTVLTGIKLADLTGQLPLAVNVHKSADEASIYTSCGDIEL